MKKVVYKKILLTHDGSKLAAAAIPHALALAIAFDTEVLLLHVVESVGQEISRLEPMDMTPPGNVIAETAVEIVAWDKEKAKRQLNKIKDQFQTSGVREIRIEVLEGSADSVIVEVAKKQKCDLIVMSTHGRSGLGRALLGSVADHVVRHVLYPVLLVRPRRR